MGGLCLMTDGNILGGVDKTKSVEDPFMFLVGNDNEAGRTKRSKCVTFGYGRPKTWRARLRCGRQV